MGYPYMIGKCELCNQDYCIECAESKRPEIFCSKQCEKEAEEQK